MADAFTTVMSNLDTLRQKSVQYESDAKQINANTVGMIMEDGAKLAKTLYTQKVEEDMTKLQNYLNEEEAKGTFNWIGGVEENGVEYDPEGIYNNYVNAANTWISENSKGLSSIGLKKSANSYLEGLKASIYSNTRSSNYDAVQQNSKSSVAQLTSTSFDPLNENGLNLKVTAAYPDYSTIDDLSNVTTYGINEDVAKYKELMARYKDGTASEYDIAQLEDTSFTIQFKLGSIIAGESDYYYENYTSKDFDDALMQFHVSQAVKAAASGVSDEYIKAGANNDVITLAKYNFESDVTNNGLVIGTDENGNEIRITAAEMGDTVFNTAVTEYSNTLTVQAANALKVQTDAWENATAAVEEEWKSLNGSLPYTSVDDYVEALMAKDGNLNKEYATAIAKQNASLVNELDANAKAEKKRYAVEQYLNGMDTTAFFEYLRENNLLSWGSVDMGWKNIEDRTDDDITNETILNYNRLLNDENRSSEEIRVLLFRSSSSGTATTSTPNVFNNGDYYKDDRSRQVTANIDNLSKLAVQAITAGDGTTIEDLYEEGTSETNVEFTAAVDEVAKDSDMRAYIEANPEAGQEIIEAKWIMSSSTATTKEKSEAEAIYKEYETKAKVRADNQTYVDFATEYLNASDEDKKAMEDNNADKLAFISELGEDNNLGKKIRSEAMVDGVVDKEKLADILNTWKGETTTLGSSYQPASGEDELTKAQTFYAKRDWESYKNAVIKGAAGGAEGIKQALTEAGFTPDDPNYASLQNLWDDLDEDVAKAISTDETGKTADEVFNALYGVVAGTVTQEEAATVLSNVKAAQQLYDGNKEVIDTIDIWLNPTAHTEEELEEAEQKGLEDGSLYVIANLLGVNDPLDPTDDDMDNQFRVAYEVAAKEYEANGVPFDLDAKKKTILKILSDKNYNLATAATLTDTQKAEYAAQYMTGKNTKSFTSDAVSLLSNGLSIEETKAELEKRYPAAYNGKLYSGFYDYLENHPKLAAQIQYMTAEEREGVINSILTSVNDSDTSPYGIASTTSISTYETKYDNRTTNEARNKELAPLFDENATEEQITKATQYMNDNALQSFVNNEYVQEYVKDYLATHEGATIEEALNSATEDIDPSMIEGGFSFYNSKTGFEQGATSGNNLYNWSFANAWKKSEGADEAQTSLVKALNVSEGYDATVEAGFSDYPAYQAIYTTLTKPNRTFDETVRKGLLKACNVNEYTANEIMDYTGEYLAADSTEAKNEAYNRLLATAGTVALDSDTPMIEIGYIQSNLYSDDNKNGYDSSYSQYEAETLIQSVIVPKSGLTGDEIEANLNALVETCRSRGVEPSDEFLDRWNSLSEDDYEMMSFDELLKEMPELATMVQQAATNTYTSWNAVYGDATSKDSGIYNSKLNEVVESDVSARSKELNDAIMADVYSSGLADFGESYQGRTPSDDLLKQGDTDSTNFRTACLAMSTANSEEDRQNILEQYKSKLTKDSLKELEKMTSFNLILRGSGIEDFKDYDFLADVKYDLSGEAADIVSTDPTDFMTAVANTNRYEGMLKAAVASKNPEQIRNTLAEIKKSAINSYICYVHEGNGSLQRFTTDSLQPKVEKATNTTVVAKASTYYSNRESSRDTLTAAAYTQSYETEVNIDKLLSGEKTSTSITACSNKLTAQDISTKEIIVTSDALALSLMGYNIDITDTDLSSDNLSVTQQKIYTTLGNMDENEQVKFYELTIALDKYYTNTRDFDSLGYDKDYTIDVTGTVKFTDGSTAEKESGVWIKDNGDGTSENITLTSSNTPISYKAEYVFGEDYVKTNAAGTKSTVNLRYSEQAETADKVKDYNTRKVAQSGVNIDYASATEMYVDPEYFTHDTTEFAYVDTPCTVKEVTGETLMNEYVNLLASGEYDSIQKAEAILSQVSDGMADYIKATSDELFSKLATVLGGVSNKSSRYIRGGLSAYDIMGTASGNKVSALINALSNVNEAEIPEHIQILANEALGRTLAKKQSKPADKNVTLNVRTEKGSITGTGEAPTEYKKSNTILGLNKTL
jgi:hypothetical protein